MTDEELIHIVAMLRTQQRQRDKAPAFSQERTNLEKICRGLEAKVDAAIKERNHKRQAEEDARQQSLGFGD